ncbi:MAG: hypothetical protein WB678_10670 [Stellaceae bacterium]
MLRFNTLGLTGGTASPKDALARAYQLRGFEIEHYWKRSTYFWAFQVAIFAAFALLWKQADAADWGIVSVALASLGVLTALANSLSALDRNSGSRIGNIISTCSKMSLRGAFTKRCG